MRTRLALLIVATAGLGPVPCVGSARSFVVGTEGCQRVLADKAAGFAEEAHGRAAEVSICL